MEEDAEPALARIAGDVAVELSVGVPEGSSLTEGGELDNHLLPLVSRLGQRRVPAVFAHKRHASASTLTFEAARLRPDDEPPRMTARLTAAVEDVAWKEQLRDACAAVDHAPPARGPLSLDLAFTVSSLRDWTSLWKPALDSLGPVLGVADPDTPWAPRDDRVVSLGLHRTVDGSVGLDVVLSAWWAPYPSSEAL